MQHQEALIGAILKLLRPLIRILLRYGVPYRSFADLAKRVYVDVAGEEFGVPGKKQTNSRISTITGLSRKEVQRIKESADDKDIADMLEKYNRAARVVSGWVRDPRFADNKGQPATLVYEGEPTSFSELVMAFSGDVPPRAILDELIQVGVVEKQKNGTLKLLTRAYIPRKGEAEKLAILGTDVAGLIDTIDHNVHSDGVPYFQRKVFYDNLPEEVIPKLQALINDRSQGLLEFMDHWMASHDRDMNPAVKGTGRKGAGIGIYYYEDDESSEQSK